MRQYVINNNIFGNIYFGNILINGHSSYTITSHDIDNGDALITDFVQFSELVSQAFVLDLSVSIEGTELDGVDSAKFLSDFYDKTIDYHFLDTFLGSFESDLGVDMDRTLLSTSGDTRSWLVLSDDPDLGNLFPSNNKVPTQKAVFEYVNNTTNTGLSGIDGLVVSGGTSAQALIKNSNGDYDYSWNHTVNDVTGTVRQIYSFDSDGDVNLRLPQDIDRFSTPRFGEVFISDYPSSLDSAVNVQFMIDAYSTARFKGDANAYLNSATIPLSGYAVIDGVSVYDYDVVLRNVNTSADQENNGLWVVSSGAWGRTINFDEWYEIPQSTTVITSGDTYSGTRWYCDVTSGGIMDVDPIHFIELTGGGEVGEAPVDGNIYGRKDSAWSQLSTSTTTIGDAKTGFQLSDHNGWIKLDGRLITTLTPTQQINAIAIGFATNIPNATGSVPIQNGTTLGAVAGSMSRTISQANLPNVNLTAAANGAHTHTVTGASTGVAGNHEHTLTCFRSNGSSIQYGTVGLATDTDKFSNIKTADIAGDHSHTVNFTLANSPTHTHTTPLGGAGTALDITPKSMSVNYFVFLGL